MLSSPGLLQFFVNFNAFIICLMLSRYLPDHLNYILILGHLCLLCSIIFCSTADVHFHLYFHEFCNMLSHTSFIADPLVTLSSPVYFWLATELIGIVLMLWTCLLDVAGLNFWPGYWMAWFSSVCVGKFRIVCCNIIFSFSKCLPFILHDHHLVIYYATFSFEVVPVSKPRVNEASKLSFIYEVCYVHLMQS
jgi:hypothetical protein